MQENLCFSFEMLLPAFVPDGLFLLTLISRNNSWAKEMPTLISSIWARDKHKENERPKAYSRLNCRTIREWVLIISSTSI